MTIFNSYVKLPEGKMEAPYKKQGWSTLDEH